MMDKVHIKVDGFSKYHFANFYGNQIDYFAQKVSRDEIVANKKVLQLLCFLCYGPLNSGKTRIIIL